MAARAWLVGATLVSLSTLGGCAESPTDLTTATAQEGRTDRRPVGRVTDLRVTSSTSSSVVLAFTEVDDGRSRPATYDVRYAPTPIDFGWGSAIAVTSGTCATPLAGRTVGAPLGCTVEGLAAGRSYDFQVVAFRGTLGQDAVFGPLSNVAIGQTTAEEPVDEPVPAAPECASPAAAWIFCDDFEDDRSGRYFEYDAAGGSFVRSADVGLAGSSGMRARFAVGQVAAGSLKLAFGRTPQAYFRPVDAGTSDHRDVYWRFYVRNEAGWTGGGADKLTRATIFSSSTTWAQAMIAHVWSGSSSPGSDYLVQDPASGTNLTGEVITTRYNDFANLRWLGATRGVTPIFGNAMVGAWHCVETHVRLNDPGSANGVFEVFVDGQLDSHRTGLDWVAGFTAYGINAILLENYWNGGSPKEQERYLDNLVVSTEPIGCPASS